MPQKIRKGTMKLHNGRDLSVYVTGMENSVPEKVKLMPFVKEGLIAEIGCGSGAVLEILSKNFPKSRITGIDVSEKMLKISRERKYSNNNIEVRLGNALEKNFDNESLDTIIFCSVLHEIFSYNNYKKETVEKAITNAYDMLKPEGRIIIRDGVKPEGSIVYLKVKNLEVEKKFYRFSEEFGPHKVRYRKKHTKNSELIAVKKVDAMEFLSKYFYDENWNLEVREQFGVHTKKEYENLIEHCGFKIVYSESYLIDFLKNKYLNDVNIFEKKNGIYVPTNYPDSTLILAAEKG